MVLLSATVFAVAIGALYYYFTRTFDYWKNRNVPGPKPIPIFGNFINPVFRYGPISEVYRKIYDSYPNEKVVGIFRMTTPCLLIRDLDIIKHVLIKDFDNFVDRGISFSKKGLSANLFNSDGDTWRALRSKFSPMFTNQKLKNMLHLLNDRADKLTGYLSEITSMSPEQDVHALVKKYTMSSISACAFGLDVDTYHEDIEALKKIDKLIFRPKLGVFLEMMYPGLLKKFNLDIFPAYVKKFFKEIVENVIIQRNGVPSNRKDFMDLILEMKNKKEIKAPKRSADEESKTLEMTNSIIEAQAFIFYAAGYETSASTMGFLLYRLALDTEIQDKVRNEINEYLKRHGNQIEMDTLGELTYLEQVFNETLRMYPIVDNLQRKAVNDYVCPGTNVKVDKNKSIVISVLGIHHDEKYYPEPEKFDPDRFSPENVAERHSCAFLPFGLGPRHCIGMRFAQVQSRVCLVRLLSKFKVEASKNTPRSFSFDPNRIVMAPQKTFYVNFFPVKH